MSPFTLLLLGGTIVTLGDVFLKKWAEKGDAMISFFFIVSMLIYLIGIIFFAQALKHKGIATAGAIFTIINMVSLMFIHVFYFHEKLSIMQIIGIILSIVAIVLIETGET